MNVRIDVFCLFLILESTLSLSSAMLLAEDCKHALLVGCTKYPNLNRNFQLDGPVNDVELMRQTLIDQFGYDSNGGNITVLSENAKADGRPTKQNIVDNLKRLGQTAGPGEPVVILLAGHGSQQPDGKENPDEPDGLDEVFLPCDVGAWSDEIGEVDNALVDDDLGRLVKQISDRGALVWLILDSCHSGSGLRGGEMEVSRHLDASELVPEEVLGRVPESPEMIVSDSESLFDTPGGLVAFYAAQPSETTPEKSFPIEAPRKDQRRYGLLTYTLCSLLSQEQRTLTYDELLQGVTNRYAAMNRVGPTPMLEGNLRSSVVLGEKNRQQSRPIVLTKVSRRSMTINAGSLHGIHNGTILAVYPPIGSGKSDAKVSSSSSEPSNAGPIGYLRVDQADATTSTVGSIEHEGVPKRDIADLTDKARCVIKVQSMPENRLRVGIKDDWIEASGSESSIFTAQQARRLSSTLYEWTDQVSDAQWIIKRKELGWALVPVGSHSADLEENADANLFTSVDRLASAIERIARAGSLLQLASMKGAGGLDYSCRVLDSGGEPLEVGKTGFNLKDGDRVVFKFANQGRSALDFTILYVDADHGITCLFPSFGELNRLEPGESEQLRLQLNAETLGREHLVTIAVRAKGPPVDFAFLQQPSLQQDRLRGGGQNTDSPLEQLCKTVLYGVGQTRGVTVDAWSNYEISSTSWTVSDE